MTKERSLRAKTSVGGGREAAPLATPPPQPPGLCYQLQLGRSVVVLLLSVIFVYRDRDCDLVQFFSLSVVQEIPERGLIYRFEHSDMGYAFLDRNLR